MNEHDAHAIAQWHYEGIYAFYDMDQDPDGHEELLNPENWKGTYYSSVMDGIWLTIHLTRVSWAAT